MAESALQSRASAIWVELWQLAGEAWPPRSVPAAWRVYQRLKETLVKVGATEAQAVAFVDDFFYGDGQWGDLSIIENHRRAIDALVTALLDAELASEKG